MEIKLAVPGEPNEHTNRDGVTSGVTKQRSPIQLKNLTKEELRLLRVRLFGPISK